MSFDFSYTNNTEYDLDLQPIGVVDINLNGGECDPVRIDLMYSPVRIAAGETYTKSDVYNLEDSLTGTNVWYDDRNNEAEAFVYLKIEGDYNNDYFTYTYKDWKYAFSMTLDSNGNIL